MARRRGGREGGDREGEREREAGREGGARAKPGNQLVYYSTAKMGIPIMATLVRTFYFRYAIQVQHNVLPELLAFISFRIFSIFCVS